MADLSINSSQVQPGAIDAGADFDTGVAAEAINAGETVYRNASNQFALADANTSAASAIVRGVALAAAHPGQPLKIQTAGEITLGAGAAPVVGTIYVLSATTGRIAPAADISTGMYTSILGVGKTGNKLMLSIVNSGAQVP